MRPLALVIGIAILASSTRATAALLEFESFIQIEFTNLGGATASASGHGVVQINGSGPLGPLDSLTLISVSPAVIDTIITVTDPGIAPTIPSVWFTSVRLRPDLQGNVLAPIAAVLRGSVSRLTQNTVPFTGNARVCLFYAGCASGAIDLPLGETRSGVMVGPGVGGTVTGESGAIHISVAGAPWTLHTVSVSHRTASSGISFPTRAGYAHGPAFMISTAGQTGGVVQFVTANQVTSVGLAGNNDLSGQFVSYRLRFIPEPGALLLFGGGALAMLLLGRRRLRR